MSSEVLERIFIVSPVANEEGTIEAFIRELLSLPYNLTVCPVMDDHSRDGTRGIIEKMQESHPGRIKLLYNPKSTGPPSCYLYGLGFARDNGATAAIEMDAGGRHRPDELPRLLERLQEGYSCVWGSRFIPGGSMKGSPVHRRIYSRGGTILANAVLGTRLRDMTSGFEALTAPVLAALDLDAFLSQGHMINTELRYYCRNFPSVEVPISYSPAVSSLKSTSVVEALQILFKLKRQPNAHLPAARAVGSRQ